MFTSGPSLTAKGQAFLTLVLAVLWVVLFSSLLDQVINMLPIRMTQVDWRFGAAGSFLASLPQLAFQLTLLVAIGTLNGGRSTIRAASIIAIVLGVVAAVVLFPFLLDFVQARRQVPVDRQANFTMAALKTGGFGGLFALLFMWTGWRGLAAGTRDGVGTVRNRVDKIVVGK
jgi:Sec-independent protein secretion pathway component TatC